MTHKKITRSSGNVFEDLGFGREEASRSQPDHTSWHSRGRRRPRSRAMQVDARFADLSLGLVDASIVVLAEELGMKRVATRDVRHFGAVRLSNGDALELVVQPTRPDRG